MITLSTEYGRKEIFLNVFKDVHSTGVSTQQFTPNSQHQSLLTTRYAIFIENIVTGYTTNTELTFVKSNSRGAYFSFIIGDGTGGSWNVSELGMYKYTINNMSTNGGINYSEKLFELDKGLFHIYNNDTFIETYINQDVETIPSTIVYKP